MNIGIFALWACIGGSGGDVATATVRRGPFEIVLAIRLREQITGELWLAIGGLLSIAFGVLLILYPTSGAITIVWIIGAFAIAFGISLIVLGWRLRGIHQQTTG